MSGRPVTDPRTGPPGRGRRAPGIKPLVFLDQKRYRGQSVPESETRRISCCGSSSSDPWWTDERDRLLIEAADALHDSARIDDDLWLRLARVFSDEQLLDLLMLCGWYHAISFTANCVQLTGEEGAPRFTDALELRRRRDGPARAPAP
jgi:hypothetical protein